MKEKQTMLKSLKDTLQQAHDMVKHFADRNRSKNLSWQKWFILKCSLTISMHWAKGTKIINKDYFSNYSNKCLPL